LNGTTLGWRAVTAVSFFSPLRGIPPGFGRFPAELSFYGGWYAEVRGPSFKNTTVRVFGCPSHFILFVGNYFKLATVRVFGCPSHFILFVGNYFKLATVRGKPSPRTCYGLPFP
jgi:hypothetical protein